MVTLELRFPAGRFHATPWGHHVNEGLVEWPPSPWRLLRALLATWHRKAAREVTETQMRSIVETLADEVPLYLAPGGVAAHTRHYMPLFRDKTTKVFDAFLRLDPGARLLVSWPGAVLPTDARDALTLLVGRLAYLGRAEAWVEGRVVDEAIDAPNVRPAAEGPARPEMEIVRLLVPMTREELDQWRADSLDGALGAALDEKRRKAAARGKAVGSVKLTSKDREKVESTLPRDLFAALYAESGDLRKQGWSLAAGSRWAEYQRPTDLLSASALSRAPRPRQGALPSVARFAVASQAPPRLTDALSMGERVRKSLMSWAGPDPCPVFAGKDAAGRPLEGHQHAFILSEANHKHGQITHLTVYAALGFDDQARKALRGGTVWGRGGHDVQLVLLGVGGPADFAGPNIDAGHCPLFLESDTWISRTPFVPTRHPKRRRGGAQKLDAHGRIIGGPEHDLARLLAEAGFPPPAAIDPLPEGWLGGKKTSWLDFHTRRSGGGGRRGAPRGFGFVLSFTQPVRGPIAVGYGAHFGLGTFVPAGIYDGPPNPGG